MSSSFVSYAGRGYWARDAALEVWLWLLAEQVEGVASASGWSSDAARRWRTQATAGMIGCIAVDLDDIASTPERAELVLRCAEGALTWLRARNSSIPAAWLNSMGTGGPGVEFEQDAPTEPFLRVGEAFVELLQGGSRGRLGAEERARGSDGDAG